MWEENLGTQAGVHLIERVCLIWGPLNTGFTVTQYQGPSLIYFLLIRANATSCLKALVGSSARCKTW